MSTFDLKIAAGVKGCLVDTSIWVEVLRSRHRLQDHPAAPVVRELTEADLIYTSRLIIAELIAGTKNRRAARGLEQDFEGYRFCAEDIGLFRDAGYTRREVCGTKGVRPGEDVFQWDNSKEKILGSKKRVHWDEVWQYDDKKLVARLIRLRALCEDCREVKHLGFTLQLLPDRELPLSRVGKHFCRVNKVGMLLFWHHVKEAELQCDRRSQHKWEVNYGEYEPLVPKRKIRRKADQSND